MCACCSRNILCEGVEGSRSESSHGHQCLGAAAGARGIGIDTATHVVVYDLSAAASVAARVSSAIDSRHGSQELVRGSSRRATLVRAESARHD